jgi:hypothetical protein
MGEGFDCEAIDTVFLAAPSHLEDRLLAFQGSATSAAGQLDARLPRLRPTAVWSPSA